MKRNSMPSSPRPPRAPMQPPPPRLKTRTAMTLIEVVAGLVILGTILASLAIARGRFARQWSAADRKLTAVKALDALVTEWMNAPGEGAVPLDRQGRIGDAKGLIWRTHATQSPESRRLSAMIVRVEVFDRAEFPVAAVDLLVHVPPATQPNRRGTP